jgi:mono/diheme cytochrome c family protein
MKSKSRLALVSFGLLILGLSGGAQALDLARGQRLYNQRCATCHGLNGVPTIQQAPSFVTKERLMQPDMVLVQRVQRGKNVCPPFMGMLNNDEILDVLQYARTMS